MPKGTQLSPGTLIRSLALALGYEAVEFSFSFPYLQVHDSSWMLLQKLKDSFHPLLRQIYSPAYLERASKLPHVVGYLSLSASGKDGGRKDDRLLREASDSVNGRISSRAGLVAVGGISLLKRLFEGLFDGLIASFIRKSKEDESESQV